MKKKQQKNNNNNNNNSSSNNTTTNNKHNKAFNYIEDENENKGISNKSNNDNSNNNNNLKVGQSDRFKKKETLIRTRNRSELYMFEKYKRYIANNLKEWLGEKKMGYITPTMGHYPQNGYMEDTDPHSETC